MAHTIVLAGVILTLYGAVLSCISNLNLGNVLVVLVGIFLMLIGIFKEKIWKFTEKGIGKIIKILVIALIVAEVILVTFIGLYGFYDNISYNEDAVIVLGAGLRGDKVSIPLKLRLDKAIEYHKKNPDAVIVVSGGQGFQETVTEAYAMEKYLIENGVDKSKIINGLIKSCEKRPVTLTQIENIANDIEKELNDGMVKEIRSVKIGDMVMERLRPIDEVSYIRFASVYRQFSDVSNFISFLTDIKR